MHSKWMRLGGLFVVVLLIAPFLAVAQGQYRAERYDNTPDRPRGAIQVNNDWRDQVSVSMWSNNRERIGEWVVRSGERVVLEEGRRSIRVRPSYKIKIGEDWGWVDVGQVGQFQNGTWYVSVRDVWQATHRDRPYDSRRGEIVPREPLRR